MHPGDYVVVRLPAGERRGRICGSSGPPTDHALQRRGAVTQWGPNPMRFVNSRWYMVIFELSSADVNSGIDLHDERRRIPEDLITRLDERFPLNNPVEPWYFLENDMVL